LFLLVGPKLSLVRRAVQRLRARCGHSGGQPSGGPAIAVVASVRNPTWPRSTITLGRYGRDHGHPPRWNVQTDP